MHQLLNLVVSNFGMLDPCFVSSLSCLSFKLSIECLWPPIRCSNQKLLKFIFCVSQRVGLFALNMLVGFHLNEIKSAT